MTPVRTRTPTPSNGRSRARLPGVPPDDALHAAGTSPFRYSLGREARQKAINDRIAAIELQRWDLEITVVALRAQIDGMAEADPRRAELVRQLNEIPTAIAGADAALEALAAMPVPR